MDKTSIDRRNFLKLTALGGGAVGLGSGLTAAPASAAPVETKAKILILGAGAAGTALANRLTDRLDGAEITLLDPRQDHYYQPGYTLIAAGLKPSGYSVTKTTDWLPRSVNWIAESAEEIDPEAKTVTTSGGTKLDYDYLVVATGLKLDYDAIDGMSVDLIGTNGIGSVYAGPDYAAKTWAAMDRFTDEGGVALFTRPATEMKCAGAPLKYTFLTEDYARRKGNRGKVEMVYAAHNASFFSVPIVNEKVRMLYEDRGVKSVYNHVMTAIDPGRKIATFNTPEGAVELPFDFTNVVPPMRAHDVVRNSPLSWKTGKWVEEGWVEVDKATLRHTRYADVFAVGDVAGVPKGKTAASVKWQVPVVEDHLVAEIAGREGTETYNGYTSCPLITRVGRAMLVEFDYDNNLTPSFPGVIAPLEELWVSWLMKEIALKATYNAMLRGRA
ncbi:twin-arginine translocation pathway signal [Roseibium aquae]|uniref:Twin-arginine translocation pathway signal n=1 Tax=Roseibium aquae TaxID=1323746 RepID=A0A916TKP8_9HYPH|nr:FAD/NAD(P)-binding oxidoreductase [Roseibium aquae]GGB49421.1 twin-arginine translocation pathway signal [Roseibium aquae]